MRKMFLFVIAMFLVPALTPFALGQRGAHGGGGSGHAGGGFGGGGSHSVGRAPSPSGFTGSRQAARPMQQGNWTSSGFVPSHNGYGQRYGGSQGYGRNHRRVGYGYGVVGYPAFGYGGGYLNGGLDLDDNDPNDPNNQTGAGNAYAENDGPVPYDPPQEDQYAYGPYAPAYGPGDYGDSAGAARRPYDPGGVRNSAGYAPKSDGISHPMVTLIFKNGRQPLQIQNYAMTKSKVFVRDNGAERDIAVSDLDVPATLAANNQAGVEFALPGSH